jgi:hypothetical protein
MAFPPKTQGKKDEMETPEGASSSQPCPGGLHDFHAGFGVVTGRSSDLQCMADQNDRCFYWLISPVSEKTSAI